MQVSGVGPPLVTPFDRDGEVNHDRLRELVTWVEARGVDFLVPCGSTSEAELLTGAERAAVVETVVDAASVPVVAGTGHPGLRETLESTRAAEEAGADAALVVTPFYYDHDQAELVAYYRELVGESPLPVYLYSVPTYTGVELHPNTVGTLATESGIVGLKDSSGSLGALARHERRTGEGFTLLAGSADLLASGLAHGADGGILAVANLRPELAATVFESQQADPQRARELTALLGECHVAVFEHGVAGLKWAMRERGAPAGFPRTPNRPLDSEIRESLRETLDALEERRDIV
jgi:dihydrodipicolinate synthase/N-acetylneuraminate lyase